jgi:hypothetical protein
MNIFSKTFILLFLAAFMLASCSSGQSTPTLSDAEIMETARATVSTSQAATQRAIPTNTPLPTVTSAPTPTLVPSPTGTSAAPDSILFIADAEPRDLTYRFALFDVESKELKTQAGDFSTMNWDSVYPPTSSGFNSAPGSQFVHYNPLTKEVVFVLFTYPASEMAQAFAESHGAPPEPPFRFEIYKTAFDSQNEFVPLYIGAPRTFSLSHTVLYAPDNALFVDAEVLGEGRHPEIRKFDIGTGQFEHIANPVTSLEGKNLRDRSDLRLSPDGQKLYQLLRYRNPSSEADPNGVFNQTLYLMTIDLDARSVDYQEIITGDNIEFGIQALSADGNRIAFFTRVPFDGEFFLWVKDFGSEQVKSIPIAGGAIGNINLFMSNDGQKILVAIKDETRRFHSRWEIYDLNTDQYQATPLDHPQAWDSSGRYLVGLKDNTYIIYDMEALSVLDIGLPFPAEFALRSIQWR